MLGMTLHSLIEDIGLKSGLRAEPNLYIGS